MQLLEHQAKDLLRKAGLPVPEGRVVNRAADTTGALKDMKLESGMCKAQVFSGGRGKAGLVRRFNHPKEAESAAAELFTARVLGGRGVRSLAVLLEQYIDISSEWYVAASLDLEKGGPALAVCTRGGTEIEESAASAKETIKKFYPEFSKTLDAEIIEESARFLKVPDDAYAQWGQVLSKLWELYRKKDCTLLEINPLALSADGRLVLVDAKIEVDDNSLFRQEDIARFKDCSPDPAEKEARQYGLQYIKLKGTIGCIANGAGLAMATMDLIGARGGRPANFLDVGGTASKESIAEAFQIIAWDTEVQAILVNIFGGIMPCDRIARGIIKAVRTKSIKVPLVVRMTGAKSMGAKELLDNSEVEFEWADGLEDAVRKVCQHHNKNRRQRNLC